MIYAPKGHIMVKNRPLCSQRTIFIPSYFRRKYIIGEAYIIRLCRISSICRANGYHCRLGLSLSPTYLGHLFFYCNPLRRLRRHLPFATQKEGHSAIFCYFTARGLRTDCFDWLLLLSRHSEISDRALKAYPSICRRSISSGRISALVADTE